uniref:Uncharacterized protein n=1 Tax=Loa loa TaxID=7209 RepID=A0A1I7W2P5_LOALO
MKWSSRLIEKSDLWKLCNVIVARPPMYVAIAALSEKLKNAISDIFACNEF